MGFLNRFNVRSFISVSLVIHLRPPYHAAPKSAVFGWCDF
jgi:hypothetical protein